MRKKYIIFAVFAVLILLWAARPIYSIVRWKMYVWLPDYIKQVSTTKPSYSGNKHLIFLFVDHYEPGFGEKGVEANSRWLTRYKEIADKHQDSYGRVPQHTWFYPYDHKNDAVMPDLAKAVFDGYGEIEFHWHHKNDTNEGFPVKLAQAVQWFNQYGALLDVEGNINFGFIHGDWSLDNAKGPSTCGVTLELDILKKAGCYADFTFPALGDKSQPRLVNRIYYAKDDERSKSYNSGIDAKVGTRNSRDLLIFEGPLNFTDYSAVEDFNVPTPLRIASWVNTDIHVRGRPDWVFVKVFTHGVQSKAVFNNQVVDKLFSYLEENYTRDNFKLHYVTAREAVNIVRAAEDGKKGDPDLYRDYSINPPQNKLRKFH